MPDQQKPQASENLPSSSSSSKANSNTNSKFSPESNNSNSNLSGQKVRYPNPPDAVNPDPATLREQWRFAIKQYSRWYSHAWGTAILAGLSFFALGWIVKGSNPLPSFKGNSNDAASHASDGDDTKR